MKHMKFTLKASLLGKLLLAAAMMIGGGSSVWADTMIFDSTTDSDISGWTKSGISVYWSTPKVLYTNSTGSITSNSSINLSDKNLVINAKGRYTGVASITVSYSTDDGVNWTIAKEFSTSNSTMNNNSGDFSDLVVDNVNGDYKLKLDCTNMTIAYMKIVDVGGGSSISAPTEFKASSVTFSSANLSWTQGGDVDEWQVYVSTTNEEPEDSNPSITNVTTNPYDLEGLSEETTYYAFVRAYKDAEDMSDWVSTDFTTPKRYPIPAEFSCSAVTGTTATLEWVDGYGATPSSWQIKYSTIQGFDPASSGELVNNVGSRSITLSELTESITYYARVRAVYADGNSNWSSQIEFTPHSEESITVNNATNTNSKAPIDGNSVKSSCIRSQFIIPSANLSEVNGRQITKLTFYTKATDSDFETWNLGGAKFEVYLKDVGTQTNFSSTTMDDWGVNVYNSGTLSISDYTMEIILDTPFNYTGGNLKIGIKQTEKGAIAKYWVWYGAGGTANSMRYSTDSNAATREAFNPKVTITSIPVTTAPVKIDANGYTTFASPRPLDLTFSSMPSGLTAYRAKVFEEEGKVRFYSDINQEVAANTGVLLAGTPGKTYMIPVAASGTTLADNDFLVNEAGGTFEAGDYTYYGMLKNSTPLAFGEFNPETVAIPSNKAYVKVTKAAAAKGFSFVFEDTATAIRTLSEAQPDAGKEVFDLSGRKVMNSSLKKGLYIIGGKKMLVK